MHWPGISGTKTWRLHRAVMLPSFVNGTAPPIGGGYDVHGFAHHRVQSVPFQLAQTSAGQQPGNLAVTDRMTRGGLMPQRSFGATPKALIGRTEGMIDDDDSVSKLSDAMEKLDLLVQYEVHQHACTQDSVERSWRRQKLLCVCNFSGESVAKSRESPCSHIEHLSRDVHA